MWFMLAIRNNRDLLTLKVFGYSNIKIFFILATNFIYIGMADTFLTKQLLQQCQNTMRKQSQIILEMSII